MKSSFPKDVLFAAVATTYHIENGDEWENASTIPMHFAIPGHITGHGIYSYPEFSQECQQIELRILDPTHLLTNM